VPEPTASTAPLAAGPDGTGVKTVSPHAWSWAALMHRAFGIDVLACPQCGGRLRLIATLHDPAVIRKILAHCHRECKNPHLEELNFPHPSVSWRERNVDRLFAVVRDKLGTHNLTLHLNPIYLPPSPLTDQDILLIGQERATFVQPRRENSEDHRRATTIRTQQGQSEVCVVISQLLLFVFARVRDAMLLCPTASRSVGEKIETGTVCHGLFATRVLVPHNQRTAFNVRRSPVSVCGGHGQQ
jgi:uncharacterized protein YbaR (Trm112 family)